PAAFLRLPFAWAGFRGRCATFQVTPAGDRPSGAMPWSPLESPGHPSLGKSHRVLAEPRPRDRVQTIRHSREAKERPQAEDVQLRLGHCAWICAPERARFLPESYGRDTPQSQTANQNVISVTLRSDFQRIEI